MPKGHVRTRARFWRDEAGQDLIEYTLMAATIAVAVAAIFPQTLGPSICQIFSSVSSTLGASASTGS
ncbi:MAG: Flp family type IVb pilin [Acidobacteria bacterium]|nr:Flp family type IVb pilin [Acidobacteriota bacterium]